VTAESQAETAVEVAAMALLAAVISHYGTLPSTFALKSDPMKLTSGEKVSVWLHVSAISEPTDG
jgi:hypothetical protein